jgi:hypothetical protein
VRKAYWCLSRVGCAVCIAGLTSLAAVAQTPAAGGDPTAGSQPSATGPASPPAAYHLPLNQILTYRVAVTSRLPQAAGMALVEQFTRQDMYVLDLEPDGAVVAYHGMAKPSPPPSPSAARAPTPPAADQPLEMLYTRYVLGTSFTRDEDGSITFRPEAGAVLPVPFLPLPPPQTPPGEPFEITVADLGSAVNRTLQLRARWRVSESGRVTISGALAPDQTHRLAGSVDMASYEYHMSAAPSCVTSLKVSERTPPEQSRYPMPGRLNVREAEVQPNGQARPIGPALPRPRQERQFALLLFEFAGARPITQEQHDALIEVIRKAGVKEPGTVPSAPAAAVQSPAPPRQPARRPPPAASPRAPEGQYRVRTNIRSMTEDLKERAESRSPSAGQ